MDGPGGGRVLVVDDDPEMRCVLADFLRGEGFHVDQAVDAAEALRHLRLRTYEAIVLDNHLPGESGLDLLPRLRALIPGAAIVLITSMRDERTLEMAFDRGAYDILLKPFSLDEMVDVLRRASHQADPGALPGGDGEGASRL